MHIAHKIALSPNNVQATYLSRAAGTARFAYNWALAEWTRQYQAHKADPQLPAPNEYSIGRLLNAIKRQEFPWMLEVTKNAPQMAIRQLGIAFRNFFSKRAGFPVFRKKGVRDRFSITNDKFKLDGKRIQIPCLGWVKMRQKLRFAGKVMSATITRVADQWFVSILVKIDDCSHLPPAENQGAVGLDFGLTAFVTLSTGEVIVGSKAFGRLRARLKRLSRNFSKKIKGSANKSKAKIKLGRCYVRIGNIRKDGQHKLSSRLTRRFGIIGMEDLHVKGMMQNHSLASAIADMGWFETRRQIEYKAQMRGGIVYVASRWYPSSKTCSACNEISQSMPLSRRGWICENCSIEHDRDVNAAINLRNLAVSSTVSACGEGSAGWKHSLSTKLPSAKQEASVKPV